MTFELLATDDATAARRAVLCTAHGDVQTPVFMPVGTKATVKAMAPREMEELGAQIILGNTYHLNLRPGMDILRGAGGLHAFMAWPRPILTDSGGYQVFSLSKLRKVTNAGVHFQSHIDGTSFFLGPAETMAIQRGLGSDIAMVLDECTPFPCSHEEVEQSLTLTLAWARACREHECASGQQLFGIVQGGLYRDLRERAAAELVAMDFDGYAIGGLSVGEPMPEMLEAVGWTTTVLPADRPRYLMGVGTPPQIIEAVACGVDMFDCVLPTRVGRNGSAYTHSGCIPIKAGRFKADFSPIEEGCACYACRNFSKAYIRHLLNVNEILGSRLMTIHNLHFYLALMSAVRRHVEAGSFQRFRADFVRNYAGQPPCASLS